MASESKGLPPGLPLLAALIVLGAGGFFLRSAPLKPLRSSSAPLWSEGAGAGSASARLWQDPLQAVMPRYNEWKKNSQPTEPIATGSTSTAVAPAKPVEQSDLELHAGLRERLGQQHEPWKLFIGLISSGNYADSESSRLDNRFAMLSALSEDGYVPEDREHLQFFVWNRPDRPGKPQFAIPFEWYRRESAKAIAGAAQTSASTGPRAVQRCGPATHVLVMWVRSDAIRSDHTLRDVTELVTEVTHRYLRLPFGRMIVRVPLATPPATVLFTTGSNRLIDIAHELTLSSPARFDWRIPSLPGGLDVIDWSATITKPQLLANIITRLDTQHNGEWSEIEKRHAAEAGPQALAELGQEQPELTEPERLRRLEAKKPALLEQAIDDSARISSVTLERVIGTDGDLLDLLQHELGLRRIAPGSAPGFLGPETHVAIIHEWDTAYGRSIPEAFLTRVATAGDGHHAHDATSAPIDDHAGERTPDAEVLARLRNYVHEYGFMKGVDGVLPDDVAKEQRSSAGAKDAPAREAPEGRSQLDYVRRLADRIDDERHGWVGGRLAAIGVFGDVFDKVPVLQALREKFPDAVLFTTDLEARLLQASSDASLRNLLVASNYGLRLGPKLQPTTPPFRSSYQTSLFLATRRALGSSVDSRLESALSPLGDRASARVRLDGLPGAARVYELAQSGPYDLRCEDSAQDAELHPPTDLPFQLGWGWGLCGSAAIFAFIGLGLFARGVGRSEDPFVVPVGSASKFRVLTPMIAAIGLAFLGAAWPWFSGPFALKQGFAGRPVQTVPELVLACAAVALLRLAFVLPDAQHNWLGAKQRRVRWFALPFLCVTLAALLSIAQLSIPGLVIVIALGITVGAGLWRGKPFALEFRHWVSIGGAAALVMATSMAASAFPPLELAMWPWLSLMASLVPKAMVVVAAVVSGVLLTRELRGNSPLAKSDEPPLREWRQLFRIRHWGLLGLALLVFLVASRAIEVLQTTNDQEPVALWDGISAWPSIGLRILAIGLGCWFLLVMREDARTNLVAITRRWRLISDSALQRALETSPFDRSRLVTTIGWTPQTVALQAARDPRATFGEALWLDYIARGRLLARLVRALVLTLLFAALVAPVLPTVWSLAVTPAAPRGSWAQWLHFGSFLLSGVVAAVVTLTVWDISNLAQRFIVILTEDRTSLPLSKQQQASCWHTQSLVKVHRATGLRGAAADAYLSIRVIADRTRWVSATIYYPFILLVLMLFANASGFDSWPRSWGIVALLAVPALIAAIAARSLQTCAQRARTELLGRLLREVERPIPELSLEGEDECFDHQALARVRSIVGAGGRLKVTEIELPDDEPPGHFDRVELKPTASRPAEKEFGVVAAEPEVITLTYFDSWSYDVCSVRCAVEAPPERPLVVRLRLEQTEVIAQPTLDAAQPPNGATAAATATAAPPALRRDRWSVVAARTGVGARITKDDVTNATKLANDIRHGAYTSFSDNPIVRAILLPFGSIGAIQIIDLAMKVM